MNKIIVNEIKKLSDLQVYENSQIVITKNGKLILAPYALTYAIENEGTLEFNSGGTIGIGDVTGAGLININARGSTVVMNPSSSLRSTGGVTITEGTLQVTGENKLPSRGRVTVATSKALDLISSQSVASLSGAETVNITSGMTLSLTDTGTIGVLEGAGTVDVANTKTLVLSSTGRIGLLAGTGTVSVVSGETLSLTGTGTVPTAITGAGNLVISGNITQTGRVSNGGTRTIASGGTWKLGPAAMTYGVANAGTLEFNSAGTIGNGAVTGAGLVNINASGGTVVVDGSSSLESTGGVTITDGTLQVTGANKLPSSGTVTVTKGRTLYLNESQSIESLAGEGTVIINISKTLTLTGQVPVPKGMTIKGKLIKNKQ